MALKFPQLTIATAVIFCHRFFTRQSFGSKENDVKVRHPASSTNFERFHDFSPISRSTRRPINGFRGASKICARAGALRFYQSRGLSPSEVMGEHGTSLIFSQILANPSCRSERLRQLRSREESVVVPEDPTKKKLPICCRVLPSRG
jgi:hypothetical protein